MQKITNRLMFEGRAEEAMDFYVSLFNDSGKKNVKYFGAGAGAMAGKVMHATFTLAGQEFECIDSSVQHGFTFTPSISLSVSCETEGEVDLLFDALSEQGKVMMPLQVYPFSKRFAWVSDRFGVSWQLNFKG